ncbi:Extracellular sugar kinase family [Elusimicrobium minutum Pei191]|uniref:Extracellular sugar kinase family n=1 Tax=Elusimicrobium minutum (strain Pei191) TaxID=445932 RepID=B2KBA2_ELUMP|nr:carbohydrate kinase [Elusimicrobium minutum]ACC97924.1 Extracellular sugar kinase family [Elusimicrobium minutum Pei191]
MAIILSVGEVLLDVFPGGAKMGGAPANFAWYCSQYGSEAYIVSAVGNDTNGKRILRELKENGVSTKFVQICKSRPTGIVNVTLDKNSVPRYDIVKNVAWDNIEFTPELKKLAKKADVICFGSLAQRSAKSRKTIESILKNAKKNAVKIFDINIRQNYYSKMIIKSSLKQSTVLKISSEELPAAAKLFGFKGTVFEVCKSFLKKFKLDIVVLTKSEEGSSIITKNNEYPHKAVKVKKLADTVGAGDSFSATFAHGFLKGVDFENLGAASNKVAAYITTKKGAMVRLPKTLINIFGEE